MDEQQKDFYTVLEAAAAWGITKQAAYLRLNKLVKAGSQVYSTLQDGKRYITKETVEALKQVDSKVDSQVDKGNLNSKASAVNLKAQLKEALANVSSLQATVEAQQAHIDSLKRALDGEQALHMATLQRLPAGRGEGFFTWVKGVFTRQRDMKNQ